VGRLLRRLGFTVQVGDELTADLLELGGGDNPAQMIALCPNCHQVKTRGSTREQLRGVLFATAKLRHERLARVGMEGVRGGD
jgi:hypothetical protein